MHGPSSQLFWANHLPKGSIHQWRSAQEDSPDFVDNESFLGHGGDVCCSSSATSNNHSQLGKSKIAWLLQQHCGYVHRSYICVHESFSHILYICSSIQKPCGYFIKTYSLSCKFVVTSGNNVVIKMKTMVITVQLL